MANFQFKGNRSSFSRGLCCCGELLVVLVLVLVLLASSSYSCLPKRWCWWSARPHRPSCTAGSRHTRSAAAARYFQSLMVALQGGTSERSRASLGQPNPAVPGSPSDSWTGSQWVMMLMTPEQAEMMRRMRAEAHWICWQYSHRFWPHRQLWSRGSGLLGI